MSKKRQRNCQESGTALNLNSTLTHQTQFRSVLTLMTVSWGNVLQVQFIIRKTWNYSKARPKPSPAGSQGRVPRGALTMGSEPSLSWKQTASGPARSSNPGFLVLQGSAAARTEEAQEGKRKVWRPAVRAGMCAESLQSCLTLRDPTDCSPPALLSMGFSRQDY